MEREMERERGRERVLIILSCRGDVGGVNPGAQ